MLEYEDIRDLVENSDTPFYIYSEKTIKERVEKLINCFKENSYQILYAMKANANPTLIKTIVEFGLGVDACSTEEIRLALACGVDRNKIFYNSDCLTKKELNYAIENNVHITVGSIDVINCLVIHHPGVTISLRINSGIGAGHSDKVITNGESSKFGISASDIQMVISLCSAANITIEGIHSHTGSGELLTDKYIENAMVLIELSSSFNDLRFINFGGGFGYDYINDNEYDLATIHSLLNIMRNEYAINENVNFIIEPGRYVIANAGSLVTQVCSVKNVYSKKYVGLDTGYNHFPRCFYYNAWHDIYNLSSQNQETEIYDITGYLCQSGDVFARQRPLAKTTVGDFICIKDVGAYGYSMSSNFNLRTKPAEYLLKEDGAIKIIRRAENFDDILSTCELD